MTGGTRSYEFARRLVASGHEVHVVSSWREPMESNDWFVTEEAGIHIHWLPVPYSNGMSYSKRILAFFRFAVLSALRARSLPSDIVFATSTPLTICIPAIFASRWQSIPMVFEVRDLWPELPIAMGALRSPWSIFFARKLEILAYKCSRAVVALSPGMRDGVIVAGMSKADVAVIPNACDFQLFNSPKSDVDKFRSERSWLGNSPLLVYAGTLGRINGVHYLVDIAGELKRIGSNVKVLVVGDGSEKAFIRSYAERAGVMGNNFFLEDSIPKYKVSTLYGAATMVCSLFVDLPEMRANSANKFFDGLAAGKPVFVNYGGWHRDLISDNKCGVVAWGKSDGAVAREIANITSNERTLYEMANNSLQLAQAMFDRDRLAYQLEIVLDAAVNKDDFDFSSVDEVLG
ncbi:glycosyltransferase family 4 protein [Zhongshania sp.]|uniref:glycosyltransferase family 4 protein n=1 Tax=Zhongshania sp. TaxID=1971902 RepID=UPI00356696D5